MADNTNTAEAGAVNSGTGTEAQGTTPATVGTETAAAGKTYTQADLDKIVTERSDRAGNAALMSFYQQNGMTEAEAKQAITDYKTSKAAQAEKDKGDLTATQKRADEAEKKAADIAAAAFTDLVEAKAESVAAQLGIDPAKLTFIRLDFSKVGKTEAGKPKAEDIKSVLEGALKVMPELKANTEPIQNAVLPTGKAATTGDDEALRRSMGLPPKK